MLTSAFNGRHFPHSFAQLFFQLRITIHLSVALHTKMVADFRFSLLNLVWLGPCKEFLVLLQKSCDIHSTSNLQSLSHSFSLSKNSTPSIFPQFYPILVEGHKGEINVMHPQGCHVRGSLTNVTDSQILPELLTCFTVPIPLCHPYHLDF